MYIQLTLLKVAQKIKIFPTCSSHDSRIYSIAGHTQALEPLRKFQYKKHVGKLGLSEGLGLIVVGLQVQVGQVDAALSVVQVHQENYSTRCRLLQGVEQQIG